MNQTVELFEEQLITGHHPQITITYFVPDELKVSGRYDTVSACLKKIDPINKPIEIPIDRVFSLQDQLSE